MDEFPKIPTDEAIGLVTPYEVAVLHKLMLGFIEGAWDTHRAYVYTIALSRKGVTVGIDASDFLYNAKAETGPKDGQALGKPSKGLSTFVTLFMAKSWKHEGIVVSNLSIISNGEKISFPNEKND